MADDMVDRFLQEISQLRERCRQLEDVLMPQTVRFDPAWGFTTSECRVFACLASRDIATKEAIMIALYSDRPDDPPEIKIVDVFICKLRRKLKPFGIKILTNWGAGYSLAERERFLPEVAS